MLFKAELNHMGHITGWPVNEREQRRIAAHMKEMTGHADLSFFIQDESDIESFISDLPARKQNDMRTGGTVCFQADPWTMAHYYGYDCQTLYE